MNYTWYPAYREAILQTDRARMRVRLLIAEQKMVNRLFTLAMDHGGTTEERQAIADTLLGIKNLRAEIALWKDGSNGSSPSADTSVTDAKAFGKTGTDLG